MTYQEATTEQVIQWLNDARKNLWLADFSERDWYRQSNDATNIIRACSNELTSRSVEHKTHKPTMSEVL